LLGAKHRIGHYFRGDITGLTVLKNQTDSDQVMQCLNSCQEKLDLAALDDMDTGMVGYLLKKLTSNYIQFHHVFRATEFLI